MLSTNSHSLYGELEQSEQLLTMQLQKGLGTFFVPLLDLLCFYWSVFLNI